MNTIYCNNPNDISSEHILQSFRNGIRLVSPDHCYRSPQQNRSVSEVLNNPINIYFMDLDSQLKEVNEETVKNCGYLSVNDALGRTARDVANKTTAEYLINNDRKVVVNNNPEITDDVFEGIKDIFFNSLTMKFPWYDESDKIIGVFGCSIILDRHSLANSLTKISQFGLLNRSLPGLEIDNKYLSKRETDCLQLYVYGKSAREIAETLKLSKRTVEHYLENIKEKFHVSTKSELIEKVINNF